jgi:hypothetical protein
MAGAAARRGGRRERRGEARRVWKSEGGLGHEGAFKIWAENATVESSLHRLACRAGCCGAPLTCGAASGLDLGQISFWAVTVIGRALSSCVGCEFHWIRRNFGREVLVYGSSVISTTL